MTRAIILAGGKGTRLQPLTAEMPKVLIPFNGRRLLDHCIDIYFKHNIFEVWLSVGEKAQQVMDAYPGNAVIWERTPRGTGGWAAIVNQTKSSKALFTEDFYVNNGDNLLNVNLTDLMEQHKRHGSIVTIACVKTLDTRDYGSVVIKNDKVTRFHEKQQSPKAKKGYINSGYYVFSPEIFDYIPKDQAYISLEKDIFPKLAKAGKLGAFKVDAEWFDCGTFARYKDAVEKWPGV